MKKIGFTGTQRGECRHMNGWYHTCRLKFLFWEKIKRMFICLDCEDVIEVSKKEQ